MATRERHDQIRDALVGDRRDLYLNSLLFHSTVDNLAGWIAEVVERYAQLAEADRIATREIERQMREQQFRG